MIVIAETCSWYSVLTTSNIGHVAEESIWGLCAALFVACKVAMRSRCQGALRNIVDASCAAAIVYVAFMFVVDVPMYWSRWIADELHGRHYLTIAQGFVDVSHRWTVSYNWQDWKHEVPWMSLYFSVAVWFSILMAHAPTTQTRSLRSRWQSAAAA